MEYKRIVAVTSLPGLFEVVTSKSDGALLRSLEDQTTKFVSSRVHNLSHLESIEIYTNRDNVNLVDVFDAMKASNDALPDVKDNKALKDYFEKVYPEIDFERVYASDLKKMVKWYEILQKNNIEIKLSEPAVEENEEGEAEKVSALTEEVTTLEVNGMDTAETAKPKRKPKTATEAKETKEPKEAKPRAKKKEQ
jgi:hypothetical protein